MLARTRFKLQKVTRYVALYGVARTWTKVQGQRHLTRRYDELPALPKTAPGGRRVGLIGCGNFAFTTIAYFLRRNHGNVIRGAMDVDIHRAASLFQHYDASYYTDDADRILEDPEIDLVYIASNHATHAGYAIAALKAGKSVHIEKPHVVDDAQLLELCRAMASSPGKVRLGFNRRDSDFGRRIKGYLDGEDGPAFINWFVAGHPLGPDHWYLRDGEGGRIPGNLSHWTDATLGLIPPEERYPLEILPLRGERTDVNLGVLFKFRDGSVAAITFSETGPTFEGVRERLSLQKGRVILYMDDYKTMTVDIGEQKHRLRNWHRQHGHEGAIDASYRMLDANGSGVSIEEVWETGNLFLRTREASEAQRPVVCHGFTDAILSATPGSRIRTLRPQDEVPLALEEEKEEESLGADPSPLHDWD